jgi:hypothetical protein
MIAGAVSARVERARAACAVLVCGRRAVALTEAEYGNTSTVD